MHESVIETVGSIEIPVWGGGGGGGGEGGGGKAVQKHHVEMLLTTGQFLFMAQARRTLFHCAVLLNKTKKICTSDCLALCV